MRRRTLLASAAAALVSAGGCGARLDDPVVKGSPAEPYTPPPPVPLPGSAEVAALESAAETALRSAAATPGADTVSLTRLAAVRAAHRAVLATTEPFWRRPAPSPSPAPPAGPAATKEAGIAQAATALVSLRDGTATRAVAAGGLEAALWGALSASAEQARLWLSVPVGAVTPAVPGRVVETIGDTAALDLLVERYHEAVYGFSSLLGFLPNGHQLRPVLVAQLTAARTRRDALVAYYRAASATPTPGAGAYSVPPVPADKVVAESGALLGSVTEAACVWVASAADANRRAKALSELQYAAGAGLSLGVGLAEWPGWPD